MIGAVAMKHARERAANETQLDANYFQAATEDVGGKFLCSRLLTTHNIWTLR